MATKETAYTRLRDRLEASEVARESLTKAISAAVEDGTISVAGAGAACIAEAIRSGTTEYTKGLKAAGFEAPSRESMQAVRKARLAAEEAAPSEDLHDLTTRFRKAAGKD